MTTMKDPARKRVMPEASIGNFIMRQQQKSQI